MPAAVESMAFFGEVPWHGLGTPLEEADQYNWETSCKKSGLDWEAELVPLVTKDTLAPVEYNAVRRKTDGKILGTVGPRYVVLQNRKAFDWFQPFLETKEASLNTAGSLNEGSRIWVLAKLNRDPLVIAKGDEVAKFILLSHAHDGTLAVRCGFTPIRVVCANTLSMAHRDNASKLIRIKHTKDMHKNLENIRETMNLANAAFEATADQYRLLARKSINQADLEKYIKLVLKVQEEDKETSTKSKNIIKDIIDRVDGGIGNTLPSVSGTFWAAYNGITEWLSYKRGHNPANRLNALWYGEGANVNDRALQTALEMAS